MEVSGKIIENIFIDFKKNEISKEERAVLLKKYLDETGYSQAKAAEKLGIKKGTLHDWLHPDKRGVARKYDTFTYEALLRFSNYLSHHEKRFNNNHLEDIKKLIKRLEAIKNRIEFNKVQSEI